MITSVTNASHIHILTNVTLLLLWKFLTYVVHVPSFKSINSSSLPRKNMVPRKNKVIGNKGFISYSRFNLLGIAIKTVLQEMPTNTYLTLCNTLHSKLSKYVICDIHCKRDVSLCMRVWKKIIRKKTMR